MARTSGFRDGPRWWRNAIEIALLALLWFGWQQALQTPDTERFVESRRAAIHLDCSAPEDAGQRDPMLARWFYHHVSGRHPGGKVCAFDVPPPSVPAHGPLGWEMLRLAGMVTGGGVLLLWAVARFRTVLRGALLGRALMAIVATVTAAALIGALVLRYRLHAAHAKLQEDFAGYQEMCEAHRETFAQYDRVLLQYREAVCKERERRNDPADELCRRQRPADIDEVLQAYCETDKGKDTTMCEMHGLHVAQRLNAIRSMNFESCAEIAEAQPFADIAGLPERFGEPAEPEEVEATPAPPDEGNSSVGDGKPEDDAGSGGDNEGNAGGGNDTEPGDSTGQGGGSGGGGSGGGAGGQDDPDPKNRTRKELIEEYRAKYPDMSDDALEKLLALLAIGVPFGVALPLTLFTSEGEQTLTRRKLVRSVEDQIASGKVPTLGPDEANRIAEFAKGDPTLVKVLPHLPPTPTVQKIGDTLACAETLVLTEQECKEVNAPVVRAAAERHRKTCARAHADDLGMAAIACCKCRQPRPGCDQIHSATSGYRCAANPPDAPENNH